MMLYQEFKTACTQLRRFMKAQDQLDAVLKVISPTSTGVVEFGNEFIDAYTFVVECALGDERNWFSWFVFENDFGKKKGKLCITFDDHGRDDERTFVISNERTFYDFVTKYYT